MRNPFIALKAALALLIVVADVVYGQEQITVIRGSGNNESSSFILKVSMDEFHCPSLVDLAGLEAPHQRFMR